MKLKPRWRKLMETGFKLGLLFLALYLLSRRLKVEDYEGIFSHPWYLAKWLTPAFFLLWAFNLLLDARIWQACHRLIENISLGYALRTNFICYALAFITPVNAGELAGRYLMVSRKGHRSKTIFLTFWSHFPRLIAKLMAGSIAALALFSWRAQLSLPLSLLAAVVLVVLPLLAFYRFKHLQAWLAERSMRRRRLEDYLVAGRPAAAEKTRLLLLSMVKLIIYSLQFTCLLLMWGPAAFNAELVFSVILFFTLSALLPSIAMADFLVKGALAILIFPLAMASESTLINATFVTWLFNIALPALGGTLLIMRENLAVNTKTPDVPDSRYEPSH